MLVYLIQRGRLCCKHYLLMQMVRASHWSPEGCAFDPRLGLRNVLSEVRAWQTFICRSWNNAVAHDYLLQTARFQGPSVYWHRADKVSRAAHKIFHWRIFWFYLLQNISKTSDIESCRVHLFKWRFLVQYCSLSLVFNSHYIRQTKNTHTFENSGNLKKHFLLTFRKFIRRGALRGV